MCCCSLTTSSVSHRYLYVATLLSVRFVGSVTAGHQLLCQAVHCFTYNAGFVSGIVAPYFNLGGLYPEY